MRAPVVILGAPRSGTTLLRRLLDAHPQIFCPPELGLVSAAARMLRDEPVGRGVPVGVLSGFRCAGFDEQLVVEGLQRFVREAMATLCEAHGKQIWVDKDVFAGFYVPQVERLLGPDARYIWLLRHGLDVAVSMEELLVRQGAFPAEFHRYVAADAVLVEACAKVWRDVNESIAGLAGRVAERLHLSRYEELVTDPAGEVARICAFLGVPFDEQMVSDGLRRPGQVGLGDWKTYASGSVHRDSVGRWRTLPAGTLARLVPIVDCALVEYGFEAVAPPAVPDPRWDRQVLRWGLGRPRDRPSR